METGGLAGTELTDIEGTETGLLKGETKLKGAETELNSIENELTEGETELIDGQIKIMRGETGFELDGMQGLSGGAED